MPLEIIQQLEERDKFGCPLYLAKCSVCGNCKKLTRYVAEKVRKTCSKKCSNILSKIKPITEDPFYDTWNSMKGRCRSKNSASSKYYWSKGITFCESWKDFKEFRKWIIEFYPDVYLNRDNFVLDRKDNLKGYCPENCRWVSIRDSIINRSNTIYVNYKGEDMPLIDCMEKYGVASKKTIRERLGRGWSAEKAILTPVKEGEDISV